MKKLPTVDVYPSIGQWRWRRTSTNGRITSAITESVHNRAYCIRAAKRDVKPPYLLRVFGRQSIRGTNISYTEIVK